MICTQGIHDDMRSLAAVIDIADDMQVVDDKALNQIAECDNTFRCLPIRIIVLIISL